MLERVKSFLSNFSGVSEEEFQRERERILKVTPVPVFWLFGKTGSGKTSIIKYLTGAAEAEIGSGFQPQTKTSREYDFPTPENAVLRFLDTRGLGESRYDPADDIRAFHDTTHVMIVTVRVMDHALEDVIRPLREIRADRPDRPVVLALTTLHQAYPQRQHPAPDPFEQELVPESLHPDLRRSIEEQRQRFEGLVDRVVPIDLTKPHEGFDEPNFGGKRLEAALVELLPAAYRQTLLNLEEAMRPLRDLTERRAMPYIISYSTMAATVAAVPAPWVDIPAVMGIQSHLVYQLASIYGQKLRTELVMHMAGAVGGRLLTRLAVRAPLKLVPVLGHTANAAVAFMYTFALGKACCWYFSEIRAGHAPSQAELERIWSEQLNVAAALWKKREPEGTTP